MPFLFFYETQLNTYCWSKDQQRQQYKQLQLSNIIPVFKQKLPLFLYIARRFKLRNTSEQLFCIQLLSNNSKR